MSTQNKVNLILKNIFSDPSYIEIICSLYEKELNLSEIADIVNLEHDTVSTHLVSLEEIHLVKKFSRNGEYFYSSANSKVCNSIISLKDAIYSIARDNK